MYQVKRDVDNYRCKMVKNSVSTLTNTALVFMISGLLISIFYDHALGSTSLPPSPPQFPPITQPELSATQRNASTNQTCTLTPSLIEIEGTPQQIEGPYFVDDMPNRSDIRPDTSNGSLQEGVLLRLILHVYDVDDTDGDGISSCSPLKDARVDIWHSNSQGVYSGVQDAGTAENDFLRGYQMTDTNGTVQFTTIYPGWYEGRAIHIHIKVRDYDGSNETLEWTSQFYLNNSINELVHTQRPYSEHGPVPMTNEEDFIYTGPSSDGLIQNNTGQHLMLDVKEGEQGYVGTFNVGVNATQ
jgi:protocatechuate 3,4-dioxygenase beta subunit